jgi:NADH-quinone oxidoreductase subunit N
MVTAELTFLIPEIALFTLACIILVVDTFGSVDDKSFTYWLSQSSLIVAVALLFYLFPDSTEYVMSMNFVSDQMGSVLKIFICALTSVVFFYSYDYLKEHELVKGEYFVLGLFAVLGMMVMASAYSLLTIYLGLELLSLSMYAMVAMHRESQAASEAAMKYFVLGALASGMLLYGISMLYGVSGAIDLASLSSYIMQQNDTGLLLTFGLVFVIVGIAFKLGAVPFHMWVPDVYQGSPTSVTLFISSAPKIAAFAMAIRLLVDGMGGLVEGWQGMLMLLSVLSMAAGNIIAISQTNIKRMLAYSTIAHVGFLLLSIASGSHAGYAGSMFYVLTYALMSMGAFGMIILLGRKGYEADSLDDFKGLASRSPWFAFMMLILMFSMAGVPPLVGFWAKWFVIKEIVAMGFIWLAAVAVLFSVIGAFYYLRIVKLMYFDKADQMTAIKASQGMRFVLSANGLALLILGFVPGSLMALCLKAFAL